MAAVAAVLWLSNPLDAAQITTTATTLRIGAESVPVQVSPARTPGYYRLVYDVTTKKIRTLVYSIGITETINGLYCADSYAEVQAYVTANGLTGLPKDPKGKS